MKAVVCTRYGPPEVLRVEDVPVPVPRKNEVRIRVVVNTFAPSRLAARRGQLSDTEHAEVVSRLGWAAGEIGYPAGP